MLFSNICSCELGFLALMHAVDMAVLTTLKNSSDYEPKDDLVLKRFPYPPYVEDTFLGKQLCAFEKCKKCICFMTFLLLSVAIQRILPLLIMLSFFYTALSIVKSIVHEKETKMKVKECSLYFSDSSICYLDVVHILYGNVWLLK